MAVMLKIIVIFIMIGVGVLLNRLDILPEESNLYVSRLVILVGSPCLLFNAIVKKELTEETLIVTIEMVVCSIVFFICGTLISYLIIRILNMKNDADAGVYMSLMTTINSSFMGFPVMQAAFGEDGLYLMIMGNIVFNIYLYSFGIIQIKYGKKEKESALEKVKVIFNPCIIASALGLFFMISTIELPSLIMEPIMQIANITVPLSMISVGMSIGGSSLFKIIENKKLIIICLTKMLLWPLLAFCVAIFLNIPDIVKCIVVMMSALPSSVSSGVLVRKLDKNANVASQGIVLSTLISVVTIPLIYMMLIQIFGEVSFV